MSEQNKALLSASPVYQYWSQITVLSQSRKVVFKPLTCRAVSTDQSQSSWFLPNFLVELSVAKIHNMHVFTSYIYALYVHEMKTVGQFPHKSWLFVFLIATTMHTCTADCFVLQEPLAGGHITCKYTRIKKNGISVHVGRGVMPHGLMCCNDPPICATKVGSSSHTAPVGFSVHWWADEGARAEGHRQFEAWHWEVKQRWAGRWTTGWLHPQAVHLSEPKRRHRSALAAFLSSMVMDSSFTTMFTCQKCFLVSCEAIKYLAWFPPFQTDHPVQNYTKPSVFKRVSVRWTDAKEEVFVLRSQKGQSNLCPLSSWPRLDVTMKFPGPVDSLLDPDEWLASRWMRTFMDTFTNVVCQSWLFIMPPTILISPLQFGA